MVAAIQSAIGLTGRSVDGIWGNGTQTALIERARMWNLPDARIDALTRNQASRFIGLESLQTAVHILSNGTALPLPGNTVLPLWGVAPGGSLSDPLTFNGADVPQTGGGAPGTPAPGRAPVTGGGSRPERLPPAPTPDVTPGRLSAPSGFLGITTTQWLIGLGVAAGVAGVVVVAASMGSAASPARPAGRRPPRLQPTMRGGATGFRSKAYG